MRIRPFRAISSLVLAVTLVAMVALTVGVTTRRWQAVPVLSGSMSPAIEAGALAFSVSTERDAVVAGDVLVFRAPTGAGAVTVHRVESVAHGPGRATLTTKGDANDVADPWGEFAVTSPRVWKVTGSVAGLGRLVLWARSPMAQLIGFVALVVCGAIFLSDWRLARRRRQITRGAATHAGPNAMDVETAAPSAISGEPDTSTTPEVASPPPGDVAPVDARTTRAEPALAGEVRTLAAEVRSGDAQPPSAMAELTRRLDAVDPTWRWEPFATDTDGAPWFERDEDGRPTAFWLRLHVDRTVRTGTATRKAGSRDVRQDLIVGALQFAAQGIEHRPLRIPEPRPSAPRPRIGRTGAIVTSLLVPLLLFGVGPGASATFTDRASDSLEVSTRDLSSPRLVSAEVSSILGSCEVTLAWIASPTPGVDGYVFDRQPIAIGTAETDALGLTSPAPTGPWETVLRVEGGSTTTATDALPGQQLQTASRFRYRARATIGGWESASSNVVEAQALGACLDDLAPTAPPLDLPFVPAPTDSATGTDPGDADLLEPIVAPAAALGDAL